MKPKYSGDKSRKFWKKVNALKKDQSRMYALGCALQNLEEYVLEMLLMLLLLLLLMLR